MYQRSWKHQLMQALAIVFAISFTVHLIGEWLGPLLPVLVAMGVLAVVGRLVFGRRRR